jgi:predicted  nucleic acid-binding Zn-ribbon protein
VRPVFEQKPGAEILSSKEQLKRELDATCRAYNRMKKERDAALAELERIQQELEKVKESG